ncbi:uncharacterized protein LOC109600175 [Aethina tumida]|uniref:uncharacterized protein LOC109600175 n=1 Tax=Aethina tumida TaxID=116153 RepID=UPI002148D35E|nr:uncharacterized protein LOC109600175 [Aethina tumida]
MSDTFNKVFDVVKKYLRENKDKNRLKKEISLERWLKVLISIQPNINKDLETYLCDIVADSSSWNGVNFVPKIVGEKLTEDGNPFGMSTRYSLACRYCLVAKIPKLFQELLTNYNPDIIKHMVFPPHLKKELLLLELDDNSPIDSYWSLLIDKNMKKIKKQNPEDGFYTAVQYFWYEGIVHFYNQCDYFLKSDLLSKCLVALVNTSKPVLEEGNILDFCMERIDKEDFSCIFELDRKRTHCLLILIIRNGRLDLFEKTFKSYRMKSATYDEYLEYLYLLAENFKKNIELEENWNTFMFLWELDYYEDYRLEMFKEHKMRKVFIDLLFYYLESEYNMNKIVELKNVIRYSSNNMNELKHLFIERIAETRGFTRERFIKYIYVFEKFMKYNQQRKIGFI